MEFFQLGLEGFFQGKDFPFAPLLVNFSIQFFWVLSRSLFKATGDYVTAREAKSVGGVGIFIGNQIIIYLFSFLVTFAIFLSFEFLYSFHRIAGWKITWWMPSFVSIILAEISKVSANWFKKREEASLEEGALAVESELEEKSRQLKFYFFLSTVILACLWLYILFGEDWDLPSLILFWLEGIFS